METFLVKKEDYSVTLAPLTKVVESALMPLGLTEAASATDAAI